MKNKVKDVKIQPMKSVKLSEEERQLRVLGLQLGEVVRQYEIIKASIVNLEKELVRLGKIVQQLQRQAELKRIEKQTEEKRPKC